MEFKIDITPDAIDTDNFLRFLHESEGGAINIFLGTTRRFTEGRETELLYYEAAADLAKAEIGRLLVEADHRWSLIRAVVVHRTGVVPVHEASVLIGVATAHREAAFTASRFLIDELKKRVPVWKRERFTDGSTEWNEGSVPE